MDEIMKEIDAVYQIISSIPVSGNSVDAMAVARTRLRKVYNELNNMKEEVPADGGEH